MTSQIWKTIERYEIVVPKVEFYFQIQIKDNINWKVHFERQENVKDKEKEEIKDCGFQKIWIIIHR